MRIIISMLLMATTGWAYQNTTLNISSCGGRHTSSRFTHVGSIIPLGGTTARSGRFYNYSGPAAGFTLQPGTAFSGLNDEWNPDNDLDGLPDSEEIIYGSNLWKPDTDNDGMGDAEEIIAGTQPTNSNSLLTIHCELQPGGNRILSWHGVTGRVYTLAFTDSLSTNSWENFPFDVAGEDANLFLQDDATNPTRFYKVKVRTP